MNRLLKVVARAALPLPLRKRIVAGLGANPRLKGRLWWSVELLRDWADRDPNAFHRFLWTHHLAYAETYDVERRFGAERIHPSRVMLFDDLRAWLSAHGPAPEAVASVFEVGCSLGYLLRHLETGLFSRAERLEGIDIDAQAIAEGARHLAGIGSRVRIAAGDMGQLGTTLGERRFDVILCAGVLMYLTAAEAGAVVRTILEHTGHLAVFAGLAHPERDNRDLAASVRRERDGTWIHDIDAMVAAAGGRVVWRRWEGARQVEGNTIYFVFAEPAR